jgi:hypothetical protein
VSNESKVLIGVGGVIVVALLVAVATNVTLGLVVAALGLIGAFVVLRRETATGDPFADARTQADETQVGNITPNQPLAPWSPDGGLNAWTPPVSLTGLPDAPPASPVPPVEAPPEEPVAEPTSTWSNEWNNNDDSWQSPTYTAEPAPSTDTNPLDELQGLDTLDPIAEVERIEARATEEPPAEPAPSGFSFSGVSRPVNEDVSGADDIMAASEATELHLAGGEQTELQKLLAKVQIRLSAYE